jgi:N-acetyl-anhydromuramyl-L-alanine amidase AmpD
MQGWGQRDKGWPDLPYHFMIAPNGQIYEARPIEYEGETNTNYDLAGHILVELMGNFETQRPSPNQIVSLVHMLAWLCQEYDCDPNEICGHCDAAPGQTSCPGRDLHRYIADGQLAQWVSAKLRGETPRIVIGAPLPDGPTEAIPLD